MSDTGSEVDARGAVAAMLAAREANDLEWRRWWDTPSPRGAEPVETIRAMLDGLAETGFVLVSEAAVEIALGEWSPEGEVALWAYDEIARAAASSGGGTE